MSRMPCRAAALVVLLSLLTSSGAWGQPPKAGRGKPAAKAPVIPENVAPFIAAGGDVIPPADMLDSQRPGHAAS